MQIKKIYKGEGKHLTILLLTWGVFFSILWPRMFYKNDAGDLVAGWKNLWSDWAMHLGQTNAIAYQGISEAALNNPLYPGIPISYPFLINWISGLLVSFGMDITWALVLPSLLFTIVFLIAFYYFGKVMTNSAVVLTAATIFLLSGGFGFIYYFSDLYNGFSWDAILYPPRWYMELESDGYYWKSIILASLVPQRSMFIGMAWMLFSLSYLIYHFIHGFQKTTKRKLFIAGLLTGPLSIAHSHSFLTLFLICSFMVLVDIKNIKYWLSFGVGVAITAIPFFPFLINTESGTFLRVVLGWYSNEAFTKNGFFGFWIRNWGLFFILIFISFYWYGRRISKEEDAGKKSVYKKKLTFYLVGVFLFVVANIVQFQPNLWDNTKILIWSYLIFSFLVASFLHYLWKINNWGKLVTILAIPILVLSSLIDQVRVMHTSRESYVMLNRDQVETAEIIRKNTDPSDLFLTDDYHLNFIPTLTGRSILMGYRGWIYSYGVQYGERERDISLIFKGQSNAKELLKKYGVDYVLIDNQAKEKWSANEDYFKRNFVLVLSSKSGNIYKIENTDWSQ